MTTRLIVLLLLTVACEKPYSGASMSCEEALDKQASFSCGASNALHIQQLNTACENDWGEKYSDCVRACLELAESCDDVEACYDDCE